jgi:hypothetical protein
VYRVKEIFYTLQGEGTHTGRPAVFCRFTSCNLWTGREKDRHRAVCQFCDTDFLGTDDRAELEVARMTGGEARMPVGSLLTAMFVGGKDTSAQVCPVLALRLRSSGGRKIADTFKGLMQDWDDQK